MKSQRNLCAQSKIYIHQIDYNELSLEICYSENAMPKFTGHLQVHSLLNSATGIHMGFALQMKTEIDFQGGLISLKCSE